MTMTRMVPIVPNRRMKPPLRPRHTYPASAEAGHYGTIAMVL